MAGGWIYRLKHGEQTLELTEGTLTVGRSRHCDLSIADPSISRKHVFFSIDGGRIRLQDLGSSNGTFVNDERVQGEAVLRDGDRLRLGDAELDVEVERHIAPPASSVASLAPPLADPPDSGNSVIVPPSAPPYTAASAEDVTKPLPDYLDFGDSPWERLWHRLTAAIGIKRED